MRALTRAAGLRSGMSMSKELTSKLAAPSPRVGVGVGLRGRRFGKRGALLLTALAAGGCADLRGYGPPEGGVALRQTLQRQSGQHAEQPADPAALPAAAPRGAAAAEAARQRAIRGFTRRLGPDPAAPRQSGAPAAAAGEISLDFDRADLVSVVRVMLEDGLKASYVIDPKVSGTVTLRTNRPLTADEVLPTLEEILRLNNAAIIERDGLFRILPRAEAGLSAPLVSARDVAARGLTVRVTPLRFVSVADVAEVLSGVAPAAGALRFDRARNLVFSTGTAAEQSTLSDMIAALDANFLANRSVALRPLEEAGASALVSELEALFATPSGGLNPAVSFLPIERMNAVLVIAEDAALLDQAVVLIRDLDQGAGESARLHVFEIANRRATALAAVLGEIFGVDTVAPSESDEIAESEAGTETEVEIGAAVAPGLTPETSATSPMAGGVGGALAAASESAGAGAAPTSGGVSRLVADEASNTLIALATADGARAIEAALRELDVKPVQVLIEATLVEVQLNEQLEYGVRWFLQTGEASINFNDVAGAAIGGPFAGFNAAFSSADVQSTLSALDSVSDVQVLSSPTLMVLDNQTARLQVGDQVPVTTRSSQSNDDANAPTVTEETYRDTGVILEIKPSVNAGGAVVLEIRQEVSDVVDTVAADNPTFAQRVVESTVAVQSGDTVALAGLIEETASDARDGIPVLSRLPLVGSAFGVSTTAVNRSELLVLIRPMVLRDQGQARAATEELRRRLTILEASLAPVPES